LGARVAMMLGLARMPADATEAERVSRPAVGLAEPGHRICLTPST
jgi:hypothetical protein